MSCNKFLLYFSLCALAIASAVAASAQADHPQTWAQDIAYLQGMTPADAAAQQSTILQIHSDVEIWIKAHPGSSIQLAPLPALPLQADQATAQLQELKKAVAAIVAQDPSHPFHLGQTEVEVSASLSALSPTVDSITQLDIQKYNAVNNTEAIDRLPGIEITKTVGKRNESYFNIRGFSSQGRVPLYLDGIPIYVPYDGNLDMSRFLSSDVAEIEVAKGFSSPLLGPGALAGSANIVTREPSGKFEGDAAMGSYSGNGLLSSLRLATKQKHFFLQGTLDWLQDDYIPLSGNFSYPTGGYTYLQAGKYNCYPAASKTNCNIPYALNDQMNNSYSRDEKWAGRFGWTPNAVDEYVFSYINQKGQKGAPLYLGPDPNYAFNKGGSASFWKWPYWNKDSYYFLSNKGLGAKSSLKARAYYDQLRNSIDMYDNNQFDSMLSYSYNSKTASASGSEISQYDDHTDGASAEFDTLLVKRNILGASVFFKDDTHRETGVYPGAANGSTNFTSTTDLSAEYNPIKRLRSQQSSIGVLDQITFTQRLHGTVGFSADHVKGISQEAYKFTSTKVGSSTVVDVGLAPYTCTTDPSNTAFSGCMANGWTVNPQVSLTYALSGSDVLSFSFEDRGDFPTLKQLYSAGMGSGLPNPDLKSEHSQNWNIGYKRTFGSKLSANLDLFRMNLRDAIESEYILDPAWNSTTDPTDADGYCPDDTKYTGYCSMNLNIGKETHEGLEVELHSRPVSRLTLDGNYSYLNRTIGTANIPSDISTTALAGSVYLPTGIPKNKTIGSADIRLPFGIDGIVSERYEGGITLQTDSNLGSKYYGQAFATTDLGVKATLNRRFLGVELPESSQVTAQTGIGNLFDRNYYLNDGFPEQGRNWFVNMRYRF